MEHPDEPVLVRYLDGELTEEAHRRVLRHVRGCGECTERLDDLRAASDRLSRELAHAGLPPSLRRAARGERSGEDEPSAPRARRAGVAAAVLLLVAGVAAGAALPSVRGWVAERGADVASLVADRRAGPPSGVQAKAAGGVFRVSLLEAAPGARVQVSLVEGRLAGAWSRGATFRRTGTGLEARVAGSESVRVELPRGVERAMVAANGRPLLSHRDGRTELHAEPVRRTEGSWVFRVAEPAAER